MTLRKLQAEEPVSPASKNLPVAHIEKLFNQLGVTRESLRGIPGFPRPKRKVLRELPTEKRVAWMKAVWATSYVAGKLNPDLKPKPLAIEPNDLEWFEDHFQKHPPMHFTVSDPETGKPKIHYLPLASEEAERTIAEIEEYLGFKPMALSAYMLQVATEWAKEAPIDISPRSASILPPDGWKMVEEDEKALIVDGVRYLPLSSAVAVIQAAPSTLLDWIKKGTSFDGRPLQAHYFAPFNRYFLSEESIERARNRFVKWPSQEPAGKVTLGETDDNSGYVGLTEASRIIGVDHHTMWRWATRGKAPTDKPLDVIKCPAADQYYIHEQDVFRLRKLVPRSGLRRGRRPQPAP